jgi:hypothetical protein
VASDYAPNTVAFNRILDRLNLASINPFPAQNQNQPTNTLENRSAGVYARYKNPCVTTIPFRLMPMQTIRLFR